MRRRACIPLGTRDHLGSYGWPSPGDRGWGRPVPSRLSRSRGSPCPATGVLLRERLLRVFRRAKRRAPHPDWRGRAGGCRDRSAGGLLDRHLDHAPASPRRAGRLRRQRAVRRAAGQRRRPDRGAAARAHLRLQSTGCFVRPRRSHRDRSGRLACGQLPLVDQCLGEHPGRRLSGGELSNLAFNRWIGDISGAFTWLDPELGLDISGAIGFEINGENLYTDYDSGNAFHADLSITKNLTKEFSIGLLAGYHDQVSSDGGTGNRIGPFKGRVTAVGASAGYNFTVAGTPITTRIRVLREVDVENRPQGTMGLFTLAFSLGGRAVRASPQPVRARY